jgi:hypothetical protein
MIVEIHTFDLVVSPFYAMLMVMQNFPIVDT